MKDNLLVDSNVLIYGETTDEEDKHEIAVRALEEFRLSNTLYISIQNLNEFSNQLLKKSKLESRSINEIIIDYQMSFNFVFFNIENIKDANKISRDYGVHYYDALLASTMRENNIFTILTENEKDFKQIPWLKVMNPFKDK